MPSPPECMAGSDGSRLTNELRQRWRERIQFFDHEALLESRLQYFVSSGPFASCDECEAARMRIWSVALRRLLVLQHGDQLPERHWGRKVVPLH